MKAVLIALIFGAVLIAQNATPVNSKPATAAPATGQSTPDPKDAEIAKLKAENSKLSQQVALYKQQVAALNAFYSTDNALKSLDAQPITQPTAPPPAPEK